MCSVNLTIDTSTTTWLEAIKYDQAKSSVALTIQPIFGSRSIILYYFYSIVLGGNTPVVITGVNFQTGGTIEVYIHGV